MKNSKLKIADFLSDSLNKKQSAKVFGGIGEETGGTGGIGISFPGGPTGTGGTGSGPVDPTKNPDNIINKI